LPHDALATQESGKTFLNELSEVGLRNIARRCRRHTTYGLASTRLRQILPRFTFRIPGCERGLEALCNYHTVRASSTGLAVDEPVHDWASHASDPLRTLAEADMASMLGGRRIYRQCLSSACHCSDRLSRRRMGRSGILRQHSRSLLWQAETECEGDSLSAANASTRESTRPSSIPI
jgi:hypothetical protein